jgi:hypothetical protein
MAADRRLFHYDTDDYLLLGGVVSRAPDRAAAIGKVMHGVNSAALGIVFERIAWRQLPFGAGANGVIFASLENAALYPLLNLEHRHPLIASGVLPRYWTAKGFAQSVIRHVVYGLVTGLVLDVLEDRDRA